MTIKKSTVPIAVLVVCVAFTGTAAAVQVADVFSCGADSNLKNEFNLADDIYCKIWHFGYGCKNVDIYVVPNGSYWFGEYGDQIPSDVGDGIDTVRVCGGGIKGTTTVVKIWGAPLTSGDYDIYLDENQDGKINPIDAVDAHLWIDFTVVPEFATIAIPAIAVLGLFLFFNKRKHKKE